MAKVYYVARDCYIRTMVDTAMLTDHILSSLWKETIVVSVKIM
jgi:hypothetical protein